MRFTDLLLPRENLADSQCLTRILPDKGTPHGIRLNYDKSFPHWEKHIKFWAYKDQGNSPALLLCECSLLMGTGQKGLQTVSKANFALKNLLIVGGESHSYERV